MKKMNLRTGLLGGCLLLAASSLLANDLSSSHRVLEIVPAEETASVTLEMKLFSNNENELTNLTVTPSIFQTMMDTSMVVSVPSIPVGDTVTSLFTFEVPLSGQVEAVLSSDIYFNYQAELEDGSMIEKELISKGSK